MQKSHPSFKFTREHHMDSLDILVEEYQHKVTGAIHYHLAADNTENVFLVALRTVPMDSKGEAHILEHAALCGSEKYPVRDPFFMMIRRSLNTFMNAFTSSDWTAYPFATENKKDFNNLLQVYMDAVFFPNLDPLDFAQEGHRLEFSEMENCDSELIYKGIVFNEMKGAMSSPGSKLWQTFTEALYPTSTYHFNSGGDPKHIPELTYEEFVEFHKAHYHPSNAVFMTFGDISAAEHQSNFESLALSRFEDKVPVVLVQPENRLAEPKMVKASYAFNEADLSKKTHIVLGWLLGENKNPMDVLKGHLLSSVLLDNSASPLRRVLEETDLAAALSSLCGLEDSNREMIFAVGVQGSEAEHQMAIDKLVMDELQRIVKEGIDLKQVEASLHQLEFSQREIGGDSYPYGLQLILQALAGAMHGGDPISLLDTDHALQQLREEVKNPSFIPDLIQRWILDNPHKVCLTLVPDANLADQEDAEEKVKLANIQAQLSDAEKQEIIRQSLALKARQDQEDDPSLLPEVTKADVPAEIKQVSPDYSQYSELPVTGYEAGTNGILYQQLIMPLPDLTEQEQVMLPLFNSCLSELGSAGRDYLTTQMFQAAVTGGVGSQSSVRANLHDKNQYFANYVVSGKALNANQSDLSQLLRETLTEVRFDERDRILDLVGQIRSGLDQGVTGNGHGLAVMAANQNYSPVAQWSFQRQGFAGIQKIKQLYENLQTKDGIDDLIEHFSSIQSKLSEQPKQALIIADEEGLMSASDVLTKDWQQLLTKSSIASSLQLTATQQSVKQAWVTNTQVSFCAKSYPAVTAGHVDAPKLAVLGACLGNGFLHSAVREQGGAYGGGASYNAESAAFGFYSYRDPRITGTYDDFNRALEWLLSAELTQAKVDESILNIISSMDKPSSPAGEAKKTFYQALYGKDHAMLMAYRQGVLETTVADLRSVAQTYCVPEKASYALLTHDTGAKEVSEQGFEVIQL